VSDRARAKPTAGGDAAGDREHILRRPADLDPTNVGRMVEPQRRPAQRVAERPRQVPVGRRERHRGRQAGGDIGGEGGSGENGPGAGGRGFSQDFGHERVRAALDALGAGHKRRRSWRRGQPQRDLTARLSRRRHQNRIAPAKRRKIGGHLNDLRQINAGQPVGPPCRRYGAHPGRIAAPEDYCATGGRRRVG